MLCHVEFFVSTSWVNKFLYRCEEKVYTIKRLIVGETMKNTGAVNILSKRRKGLLFLYLNICILIVMELFSFDNSSTLINLKGPITKNCTPSVTY